MKNNKQEKIRIGMELIKKNKVVLNKTGLDYDIDKMRCGDEDVKGKSFMSKRIGESTPSTPPAAANQVEVPRH